MEPFPLIFPPMSLLLILQMRPMRCKEPQGLKWCLSLNWIIDSLTGLSSFYHAIRNTEMGRKPCEIGPKVKIHVKNVRKKCTVYFLRMGTYVDISCLFLKNKFSVLPCVPLSLFNAMSCSDPRDDDYCSEEVLCMVVSKIAFLSPWN